MEQFFDVVPDTIFPDRMGQRGFTHYNKNQGNRKALCDLSRLQHGKGHVNRCHTLLLGKELEIRYNQMSWQESISVNLLALDP
jgi:hypothetical protein